MDARTFNYEKMQWLNGVSQDGSISSTAFRVVYRISDYLNKVSGDAWPSYETLARQVSLSKKSVQRAVAALRKAGWLQVDGCYKKSNRYRPAWPPGFQRKPQGRKREPDKSAPEGGRKCPGEEGTDVLQSYLRNLPRTNLSRLGEARKMGRSFPDRGRFEKEIVDRFGQEAEVLLEDLQHFNPTAIDELCRDQRDGLLTEGQFDSARLGILEIKRRRVR